MLHITEINEESKFFELENEWDAVLQKSSDDNFFLTWEFLSTFWNHFGNKRELRVLVIKDKDEIIAIAPFRQSRYTLGKMLGYNVIEPLGYGGDYTGLILTKKKAECFRLFLHYLAQNGSWDFIYLFDLPATSTIPELLQIDSKSVLPFELKEGIICPFIHLPESSDVFMESLDHNLRKDLKRCLKNLERDYQKVELKKYDELGSVENGMNIFFQLHQKRWNSKLMDGVFKTQAARNFYIDVANKFANKGWLALYFLTLKDKPIAAQYCIEYERKMHYVLGGFDIEYSKYGVGNLLIAKVLEDCIKRRIKEYDFMKGNESYKFRWTEHYRRNFGIKFISNKLTSRLFDRGIKLLKQTGVDRVLGSYLDF